jgi:hypothetical protein
VLKKKVVKKKAAKRTRSQAGKMARASGGDFERRVAHRLRQIYDSSALRNCIDTAPTHKERLAAVAQSCVHRGRQSLGAAQHVPVPDLVAPCRWWFELEWAQNSETRDRVHKLEQAERDIKKSGDNRWPVVVWAQKGSPIVWVTLRAEHFVAAQTADLESVSVLEPAMPVIARFDEFEKILISEHQRNVRTYTF